MSTPSVPAKLTLVFRGSDWHWLWTETRLRIYDSTGRRVAQLSSHWLRALLHCLRHVRDEEGG